MLFVKEMPVEAREKILFAGLKLFADKGYKETSILEIVEKAHVSKSTYYQFFKGKEDLLISLCLLLADEIFTEVKNAVKSESYVNDKAYKGILRYIEICFSETEVARLLLVVSAGVSPEAEKVRLDVYRQFARLIFESVDLPETVTEKQISVASQAMVGAINHAVIQSFISNEHELSPEELAGLLSRIVIGAFISLSY
ncbi:TetR/AcrR family transcriptional regulator [Bacillus sp. T33-2]|uniref:TetR/AcrR family transcriptional regulator n=1 Tax=Bacillus sp. T33-2 TaxID=2054168 RepID=UPI0015E1036C|nr:TetR/AcrR family transcriptional regulator [Bacillus sp. T33-2]